MERIDKFLSNLKYGSREDIKKAIKNKLVRVNNLIIKDPSLKIDPNKDQVMFKESIVFYKENVSLMMNKPKGYVCATTDNEHKTVLELLKEPYNRLDFKIIGRLDKDTEGLMLLTNDGILTRELLFPSKKASKLYYAQLKNPKKVGDEELFMNGVTIDTGYRCQSAELTYLSEKEAHVRITEGKFHQVKKMFEAIGNEVVYLKRLEMKGLKLDPNLKLGEYRELTAEEMDVLGISELHAVL